jgi:hypothetical protein
MGNCGSATKVINDLWEEYDEQAKVLGCTVASIVGEHFGAVIEVQKCLEAANKVDEMLQNMISFWNDSANDSWAKIGPRRLDFGERKKGTLVGTFERIFISPMPMVKDKVTVQVRKRDGKGKASVTVCKVDAKGRTHELWDTLFEPGKNNIGREKTKTLTGVGGNFLQIHLDGKSVSREFAYSLKVEPVSALPQQGVYTIQQESSGRFLDAHQRADEDFSVVTRKEQNNDTQRWILMPEGNVYTLQQKSSGRFLDAHQRAAEDFNVVTRKEQNNDTQRWILTPEGNGFTIRQQSSDRFLDAHQRADEDFAVVTRKEQNNDTQRWLIKAA